jgi:hypothetical protein
MFLLNWIENRWRLGILAEAVNDVLWAVGEGFIMSLFMLA